MRLTKKNYHTLDNKYLSSSKIKDFLKDPNYFYKRHVTGEIIFEPTPSMRIGSAVDLWLTGSKAQFDKTYCKKVMKKDNPDLYKYQQECGAELLSPSDYEKVEGMCERVRKLSVYKDIKKNFKSQKILKIDKKLGLFDGIAGIPDWYYIFEENGIEHCVIVDLKTAQNVHENKFKYVCMDYGYYLQQAVYQMLLSYLYPNIKDFQSFILAVENTAPYITNLFELDQQEIEFQKLEVTRVLDLIASYKVKDFKPKNINWEEAIKL